MTVADFFAELGGVPHIAEELRLSYTTVVSWRQRNAIPPWRVPALSELALRKGKTIPAELVRGRAA